MKPQHWLFALGFVLVLIVGALLVGMLYDATIRDGETSHIQAIMAHGLDAAYDPIEPGGLFSPDDTFYLSVRTERAPAHSIISARWYYEGTVIMTQDQSVGALSDVYVVGFEMERTDQPWPVGQYSVDVLLNGESVGQVRFRVENKS
jgi:hypothetical protein